MIRKILLLAVLLLLARHWALAEDYNNITISGTIQHPEQQAVQLVLFSYVPGQNHLSVNVPLTSGNNFRFASYIREAVFGQIIYGDSRFPLYLEPGYDLRLTLNGQGNEQSLDFSGVGARNNAFLASRYQAFQLNESELQQQIKRLDVESFRQWADGRKEAQLALLRQHQEELSNSFVGQQKDDIIYQWANQLFAYAQYAAAGGRSHKLPEDFYDFMDEPKLHNYEQVRLESYCNFLNNYLLHHYELMKASLSNEPNSYYSNMYQVARNSLRSLPMYHMQAVYLVKALKQLGVNEVKDEYIEFANECPVQPYKNVLHQMVKEQSAKPRGPEIIFTDEAGRSIPLRELSGRIVLLRFTNALTDSASQLMRRHDEALKEKIAAYQDVEFLQLPMSSNKEAFEKMVYADVTEYLKSIMNRPKPGQEKPEAPAFSYVLLNSEGLVVSNSLDDPQNQLALEKIDALIRQEQRSVSLE